MSTFSLVVGEAKTASAKRLATVMPKKYAPNFTFVVVQKRINTRIFAVKAGPGGKVCGYFK